MRGSGFSPTSLESELSEMEGLSSKRLATESLSTVLNIDKTVAKSRQILQDSLEVSRKNQERRHHLEERLKHILSVKDSVTQEPSAPIEPQRKPDADYSFVSVPEQRSYDLRFLYEQEQMARERAESQTLELKKRIAALEHLHVQYDKVVDDLKDAREELRKERLKTRDFSEYHVQKEKEISQSVQDLEATVRRLRGECDRKEDDRLQLERSLRKSDEQRGELLKEAELQRQTIADLKKLHLRELEDIQKRLEEVAREKSDLDRQLRDVREEAKSISRRDLERQTNLEAQLRDAEGKYSQQLAVTQDLQAQVQSLQLQVQSLQRTKTQHESRQSQELLHSFETQMMENTRKIHELQVQLDQSRKEEKLNDSVSSDELTRLVRKEQIQLGLSGVLRPRNENRPASSKGRDLKRVYASAPRRRTTPKAEKRLPCKCRHCFP